MSLGDAMQALSAAEFGLRKRSKFFEEPAPTANISGDNPGPMRYLATLDVQSAIVDGINRYVHFLEDSKLLAVPEEGDDWNGLGTEPMDAKYRVATEVAVNWTNPRA